MLQCFPNSQSHCRSQNDQQKETRRNCPENVPSADWKVGGDTATAGQLALLDKSIFFWRGHFESLLPRYIHEDGGKLVTEVVFHAMHNNAMQQGHYIYTIGAPELAAVAIEISVS